MGRVGYRVRFGSLLATSQNSRNPCYIGVSALSKNVESLKRLLGKDSPKIKEVVKSILNFPQIHHSEKWRKIFRVLGEVRPLHCKGFEYFLTLFSAYPPYRVYVNTCVSGYEIC